MSVKDPAARREYLRRWYAKNADRIRARASELDRARRAADPEKYRAKDRAEYAANPDRCRASAAKYRAANPEKVRAANRASKARHSDRRLVQERAYREANPDKVREWRRAWRAANQEHAKATMAQWRLGNPHVSLMGQKVRISALPPEVQEVASLLRQARQVIRSSQSGGAT